MTFIYKYHSPLRDMTMAGDKNMLTLEKVDVSGFYIP